MTKREACVMSQLSQRRMYGLELVAEGRGVLQRNSVYVLLTRMADKGWVVGRPVPPRRGESGPPRRVYRPTRVGLAHWRAHRVAVAELARAR